MIVGQIAQPVDVHGQSHVHHPPGTRRVGIGLWSKDQWLTSSISKLGIASAQSTRKARAAQAPAERNCLRVVLAVLGGGMQVIRTDAPVRRAARERKENVRWRHDVLLHDHQIARL